MGWELLVALLLGFGGGYVYKDCPECRSIEIAIDEYVTAPHTLKACKEGPDPVTGITIHCMAEYPRYVVREEAMIEHTVVSQIRVEALRRCVDTVNTYNRDKTK